MAEASERQVSVSYEDRLMLMERYDELVFMEQANSRHLVSLRCTYCSRFPIVNLTGRCGHPYCVPCFSAFTLINSDAKCLLCPFIGDNEPIAEDFKVVESILNMEVACPNFTYGCKAVMDLGALVNHIYECDEENNTIAVVLKTKGLRDMMVRAISFGKAKCSLKVKHFSSKVDGEDPVYGRWKNINCFPMPMKIQAQMQLKCGLLHVVFSRADDGPSVVICSILPRVTYTVYLQDEIGIAKRVKCVRVAEKMFDETISTDSSEYPAIIDPKFLAKLVFDDTLKIKVKIDFPHNTDVPKVLVQNGVYNFDLLSRKNELDRRLHPFFESIYSEFFYTGNNDGVPMGYRVKAGLHLTEVPFVSIDVLTGPYDEKLNSTPAFLMKIGLRSVDEFYPELDFIYDRVTYGCSVRAVLPEDLEPYTNDNCLYIQIVCLAIDDHALISRKWAEEQEAKGLAEEDRISEAKTFRLRLD